MGGGVKKRLLIMFGY